MIQFKKFFGILILSLSSSLSAHASTDNTPVFSALFSSPQVQVNPARHTFVFWVNGDADHFVTATGDGSTDSKVYRADKFDVERLVSIAGSCGACNVVILHDQRGSSHWYTANKPWATYLRVFSRGQEVLERHVNEADMADARLLARLLEFSEAVFPQSELHLIYRGHSFRTPYMPQTATAQGVLPFDYSEAGQPYDIYNFRFSLQMARLKQKLASVTLASCSMASLEMAALLAPKAKYFVASEVNVLETLDVGFRFESLNLVSDQLNDREVSHLLASLIFEAFETTPAQDDAMMEFPATWVDLAGISELASSWNDLSALIQALPTEQSDALRSEILRHAHVTKNLSPLHLERLKAAGKSPSAIATLDTLVRMPAHDGTEIDWGQILRVLLELAPSTDIRDKANDLLLKIKPVFRVVGEPQNPQSKSGLSLRFGPRGLPRL